MKLKIERISEEDLIKIQFWHYTPPYDWYNLELNETDKESFLFEPYFVAKDS